MNLLSWLTDPANWTGFGSIPEQVLAHLGYSLVALVIAMVIAIPAGLAIGVTGRGTSLVAGVANALRALPSIGVLILAVMVLSTFIVTDLAYQLPTILVLVMLGVPPMLTSTYAGIESVDPAAVDAARGMGYSTMQRLRHVQLPCALPLILSGIRSALLQIVSTATIAAIVSLGGLGRFIVDGGATSNYPEMLGGAVLVAALALAIELVMVAITVAVVSPGLRRRVSRRRIVTARTAVDAVDAA